MRRLILGGTVAALLLAAGDARAATVGATDSVSSGSLTYNDEGGAADDVRVTAAGDGRTLLLDGPGIRPGPACHATATGVACVRAEASESSFVVTFNLGGGDDRVIADPVAATVIGVGGDGNDTIQGFGNLRGDGGNDTLTVTVPEPTGILKIRLKTGAAGGGPGDDVLAVTGGSAELEGGAGRDALTGSGFNDVLMALDGAPGDVLRCGGGRDFIGRDQGDTAEGCASNLTIDPATRIRHRFRVYAGGFTVPVLLRVRKPSFGATGLVGEPFALCSGRGCRGARFRSITRSPISTRVDFKLRSGGQRVPGRRVRALRSGALLVVGFRFLIGEIEYTKAIGFSVRASRPPTRTKVCFFERVGGDGAHQVPCDV